MRRSEPWSHRGHRALDLELVEPGAQRRGSRSRCGGSRSSAGLVVTVIRSLLLQLVSAGRIRLYHLFGLWRDLRLTPTSYIVLGLLDRHGEATPYELKGLAAAGVGNFWSLQHAQLYTETARLAEAGYLDEEREDPGAPAQALSPDRSRPRGAPAWVGDADRPVRRAPRPRAAEALLRGRPEAPRRGAARDPPREARRVRGARRPRHRGGALGAGRDARRRPRPRARVGAVLV